LVICIFVIIILFLAILILNKTGDESYDIKI